MRSPSVRLFIALWPTDEVRASIAQWQSRWTWPDHAAVVPPEKLHLTLHFLGNVTAACVRDLQYVLKSVPTPPFGLRLTRQETWQHSIVALRPENSPTQLRALHARIGLALAGIGLPVDERPYRPHVTLARRAANATPPVQTPDVPWQANSGFVLAQSLGGGRGYEVLERFGTRKAAA
jgi:2'-5' RNA ligase